MLMGVGGSGLTPAELVGASWMPLTLLLIPLLFLYSFLLTFLLSQCLHLVAVPSLVLLVPRS